MIGGNGGTGGEDVSAKEGGGAVASTLVGKEAKNGDGGAGQGNIAAATAAASGAETDKSGPCGLPRKCDIL